jgi:trk system potassium uptake protein TrkA
VQTLYRILDGKAEAAEFYAAESSALIGKPLRELSLRENVLIACVSHRGSVIMPDGNTVIHPRDSVIVINAGEPLSDLDDILRG